MTQKRAQEILQDEYGYCERCGKKLTPDNNNGFELCNECDKQFYEKIKTDKEKKISYEQYDELDGLLFSNWRELTEEDVEAIKKIIIDAVERNEDLDRISWDEICKHIKIQIESEGSR